MCFPVGDLVYIAIFLIIVVALFAIIRILLANLAPSLPWVGPLIEILRIGIWAIVAIACVYLVADLIICLLGVLPRPGLR